MGGAEFELVGLKWRFGGILWVKWRNWRRHGFARILRQVFWVTGKRM